jgi:transposase
VVRKSGWSKQVEQQVQHLRREYPFWGKKTLWAVLRRDKGVEVSESTVGRILKKLVNLGRVKPV